MEWKRVVVLAALFVCASLAGCDAHGGKKALFDISNVKQDQNYYVVMEKILNEELTPEQVIRAVASAKRRLFGESDIDFDDYITMNEIEKVKCFRDNLKWWDGRCEKQPSKSLKNYCDYCHDKLLEYCEEVFNEQTFFAAQRDMLRHGMHPTHW